MTARILAATLMLSAMAMGADDALAQGAQDRARREPIKEKVEPKKAIRCKVVNQRAKDRLGKTVIVRKKVCR